MGQHTRPTILVIVGIRGDLSRRKLLPALARLAKAKQLPQRFKIIGVSRQTFSIPELVEGLSQEDVAFLAAHIETVSFNLGEVNEYQLLAKKMGEVEKEFGEKTERLFYLSVPPEVSKPLIEHLGTSGLAGMPDTKVLLEKPFGVDEISAQDLVAHIDAYFEPEQVYRIDHYMAKEMAQNIIAFRQGNSLFKRTWNGQFIESIEIVASEQIGVEGRAHFYEQTGALRDVMQSHLMQLAALVLMELPTSHTLGSIPGARLTALQFLKPADPTLAVRAQYAGYSEEVGNPASLVETFVSLTLASNDPRWTNTPIRLVAGKSLQGRYTEVRVNYHKVSDHESNELVLRLQPQEGIGIFICLKEPGFERRVERQRLQFSYDQQVSTLPSAYEHVLLDAMRSDHSLFTTSDEVMASWRVLQPLLDAWAYENTIKSYPVGAHPDVIS